jgi:hypothetical protein
MLYRGKRSKKIHDFRKKLSRNILVSPIKKGVCEKFGTRGKLSG